MYAFGIRAGTRARIPGIGMLALLAGCAGDAPAPALPSLTLDPARTTVSGISSGAYMASQVHLAYSDRIAGAALIAGGPYGCARGRLETALSRCLAPAPEALPDAGELAALVRERAANGSIAALAGIAGDRVHVFHGTLDTTVGAAVSGAAAELYRLLGADVQEDSGRAIAHTFPTESAGVACELSEPPYIGRCGYDAAAAIFATLEGRALASPGAGDGELRRFDQNPYREAGKDVQLADHGYVYVPRTCAAGATCALHVAFHGCQQNVDAVGEAFVRDAGYNRWADAHGVVVLYPQTRATFAPLNPKACWDWWGYGGADYDTRAGAQLRWVARAAAALGAPLE